MSYPYHHFYALNNQPGHQLFYDQVLQTYSAPNVAGANYVAGAYMADGSLASWGKDCSIKTTDQYNMPSCCSTWADGHSGPSPVCCSCTPAHIEVQPAPIFFPVSAEQEVAVALQQK